MNNLISEYLISNNFVNFKYFDTSKSLKINAMFLDNKDVIFLTTISEEEINHGLIRKMKMINNDVEDLTYSDGDKEMVSYFQLLMASSPFANLKVRVLCPFKIIDPIKEIINNYHYGDSRVEFEFIEVINNGKE